MPSKKKKQPPNPKEYQIGDRVFLDKDKHRLIRDRHVLIEFVIGWGVNFFRFRDSHGIHHNAVHDGTNLISRQSKRKKA